MIRIIIDGKKSYKENSNKKGAVMLDKWHESLNLITISHYFYLFGVETLLRLSIVRFIVSNSLSLSLRTQNCSKFKSSYKNSRFLIISNIAAGQLVKSFNIFSHKSSPVWALSRSTNTISAISAWYIASRNRLLSRGQYSCPKERVVPPGMERKAHPRHSLP